MKLINGSLVAKKVTNELESQVQTLKDKKGIHPCLCVLLIGDNPASQVYVQHKIKACQKIGIQSKLVHLAQDTSQDIVLKKLTSLSDNPAIHGILIQLPLPPQLRKEEIFSYLPIEKDVDGLTVASIGSLWSSLNSAKPCTPQGIIYLLKHYQIPIQGKHAVVVGRSQIVGRPMAQLLLEQNATVTICHSKTQNLEHFTQQADILIAACGQHHKIKAHHIKKGATIIDVGIHRIEKNGKTILQGDVCPDELDNIAEYMTPVPGGVGPMTIAMLLKNTIDIATLQK